MITVRELIEQLQELPPETTVWMSSDGEGNEFKPLYEIDLMDTFDEEEYDGEVEKYYREGFEDLSIEEVIMFWPGG